MKPLQTIEDYLELKDWAFRPQFKTGQTFWDVLDYLQPYCYVAGTDKLYFISTDKDLVDVLHSRQALDSAEKK